MIRYLNKMPTNVKQESEMKRLALEHFLGCFMILGAGMIIASCRAAVEMCGI